jgi:hypothetical protein
MFWEGLTFALGMIVGTLVGILAVVGVYSAIVLWQNKKPKVE